MKKIKLLTIVGFFLVVSGHAVSSVVAAVSSELEKNQESLPLIISVPQFPYRINDTVKEFEYLRKYYGVNETYTFIGHIWDKNYTWRQDLPKLFKEMKDHGFFITGYQGGGVAQLTESMELPRAVDEQGKEVKVGGYWADKISPRFFPNYIKPMIDKYIEANVEILRIGEYGLYHPAYSEDDIEQFRKDLLEEDEGIDWIFHDGHIEHLNFWTYAKAQLGIKKEDYQPNMLGEFSSYKEYIPAKIRGGGDVGDFIIYSCGRFPEKVYGSGEKYWRNVNLYRHLYEYEYFKNCQKYFKYSKANGMKYNVWGPHGGQYRDMAHDPYIDYMEVRANPPRIAMIPGLNGNLQNFDPKFDTTAYNIKSNERYLRVSTEMPGKARLFSVETIHPSRLPIAFYRDGFSTVLVEAILAKPKFFMTEFPVSEAVFDKGLPYSVSQFNLSVLDAYRQVTESGLNNGNLLKSNWLIQTAIFEYKTFGDTTTSPYPNFGDMKSELYLRQGYIPDIEPCHGEDRIPLENYKVVTMGGENYSEVVVDNLKKWLEKGSGRTLFTNYLYLARFLWGSETINGKRYTKLGIWNTSDIKEYKIKEVTWVDRNILADVKLGKYFLEAALPADSIQGNLSADVQVIMKGMTEGGEEVPLITIIPKGKNRIINIAFALKEYTYSDIKEYLKLSSNPNLELGKNTMFNLFSYIQRKDNFFITRVKCSYPMDIVFRSPVIDAKGVVTVCAVGSGKPIEEDMIIGPVSLEYENHKVVSKIDERSMVIASLDGSALASCYSIDIDGTIYVKEVEPETLYVLAAIDNKSYDNSKLFHLWTYEATTIKFLKPKIWGNEKKIKVYNFEGISPAEIPFEIKNGYIELKTEEGHEYKISYGKIEDSLWKKFCARLAVKEELQKGRFDDSGWKKVRLSDIKSYIGDGWYRLHYKVPESWKENSLVLELGRSVLHNAAIIYFNGENQDSEDFPGWGNVSYPRRVIISKNIIKYGEDNVISVRISNLVSHQAIYGGPIRLVNPAKAEVLDLSQSDWLYKEAGNRSCAEY